MKRISLSIILALSLSGCVTTSSMLVERGYIDTDPQGANITLYDNYTGKVIDSVVSPSDYLVNRSKCKDPYLKVEKGGFQVERIPVPREGTDMDIYVPLIESYGNRIKRAKSGYTKDFLRGAEHTLSLCEKAYSASRFSAPKFTKEASFSFDDLKATYPNERSSALVEALGIVIETLNRLNRLNSYYYGTKVENELKEEANEYISYIRYGLEG